MNSELTRASKGYVPSLWWLPMAIVAGCLLGVAVGALVGDLTYKPDNSIGAIDLGRGFNEAFGAAIGGLIGAGLAAASFIFWRERRKARRRRTGRDFRAYGGNFWRL